MKSLRRLINTLILSLAGLYLVFFVLLHLPVVKGYFGHLASDFLSQKLGTHVEVGSIDIGLFDRVTIDDISIYDQKHKKMVTVSRASVNMDILELIQKKGKHIAISSAQLISLDANIYKETADSKPNFQFIIDSLSSKDKKESAPLDLDISSVIIRNSKVSFNQMDMPLTEGRFSPHHLAFTDINSNIRLRKLTNDSLNIDIKNTSFKEHCGLDVKSIGLSVVANTSRTQISNFKLEISNSDIDIPSLVLNYRFQNKKLIKESLSYDATINPTTITPSELAVFMPKLKPIDKAVSVSSNLIGNKDELTISKLELQHAGKLSLDCDAYVSLNNLHHWATDIRNLYADSNYVIETLSLIGIDATLPPVIKKLGNVTLVAKAEGDELNNVKFDGNIKTALGDTELKASLNGSKVAAFMKTPGIKLGEIVENMPFGNISGIVEAEAIIENKNLQMLKATADITDFDYNSYRYKSIKGNGVFNAGKDVSGTIAVVSPSANFDADGSFNLDGSHTVLNANVKNFQPAALKIPQLNIDGTYSGSIKADISGLTPKDIKGSVDLNNISIHTKKFSHNFNHIYAKKEMSGDFQKVNIMTDFGYVIAEGVFDYPTLAKSVTSCLAEHLPTLPGIPAYEKTYNNIKLTSEISDISLAKKFFNLPLDINQPIYVFADIDDRSNLFDVSLEVPHVKYKENDYLNGYVHMVTVADSLKTYVHVDVPSSNEVFTRFSLKANAFNNQLTTRMNFENNGKQNINGSVYADAVLSQDGKGQPMADVHVRPSTVMFADSIWNILSSDIHYAYGDVDIKNLHIAHNNQYVKVNGHVSDDSDDEINVDINDVNVASILNLVKFRAVDFTGNASGTAKITNFFDSPYLSADLKVKDFHFESGRFGDLYAKANWHINDGDVMIDARAQDAGDRHTLIKGFISPKRKELLLDIKANGTRLEFVNKYTSSFMNDIDIYAYGDVRLFGPFKGIDLEGKAIVDGSAHISSLNTTYTMNRDSVILTPGDIHFCNDTIRDKYNNIGIANGHLYHTHFGKITYAFDIDAQNLLGYDTHTFGSDTFYGTAFATGNCIIRGKSGETLIDITAQPGPGSRFVYNVTSPDAISNTDFIRWTDRNKHDVTESKREKEQEVRADLKLNFDINATPDLTLELLMDASNGDYITLNGNGNLNATYYNKGAFNLFGNYMVDHGVYRLTIQNVIRRMFEFQSGGSIGFNGDAYNAKLNLQALYPVNGVSLSDINIGKRFTNNNIRVNCLMDITGTPYQPLVGFRFDMPTVSTDIKSMVNSLINSEEEMNQQVLYLLAVGRFYNPTNNYAETAARQSQTSLAMQSILSGTISQQLSNVLGTVVDNNNWNIGANISTGDEGFNNAEYEGLISGRMLNSRLLFNGQFGYRDNPNATTSFIGDFDLRYLLLPNGDAALKVYNQTNDKYFTKNSLNTQGIGLILKKDFTTWRDLFNITKKKK